MRRWRSSWRTNLIAAAKASPAPPLVEIWTDGSCYPNPGGPGGYGIVYRIGTATRELHGGERSTTNNRMEMLGAIVALESLQHPATIRLHTDSQYVQRGINEWVKGWKARGWRTATGSPVANVDLWQRLDAAVKRHTIEWKWVRGHNGDPGNERADELALRGRLENT